MLGRPSQLAPQYLVLRAHILPARGDSARDEHDTSATDLIATQPAPCTRAVVFTHTLQFAVYTATHLINLVTGGTLGPDGRCDGIEAG
jgi:hypothetical protein